MIEQLLVSAQITGMPNTQAITLPDDLREAMRPENIGYRLRLIREAHGLKPAQISDMLGIERTYWSRFEGGKRAITEPVAAMLVDRFGVSLDFIILGKWDKLPLDLAQKMRTLASQ